MANKQSKLVTLAKIFTNRQLTQKEMGLAENGFSIDERNNLFGIGIKTKYLMHGENPVLTITNTQRKTTEDVSDPNITHTRFYDHKTTEYMYDSAGKLIEKSIKKGFSFDGVTKKGPRVVQFDPPGCWIGRRVETVRVESPSYG